MEKTWNIEFYKTHTGESPVEEFIFGLPAKDRTKVLRTIQLLQTEGIRIRAPHAKALEGEENLYELRVLQGSNAQRIFYFNYTGQTFVLLHGFTKKSQKTPPKEIKLAVSRKKDYLAQKKEVKNA